MIVKNKFSIETVIFFCGRKTVDCVQCMKKFAISVYIYKLIRKTEEKLKFSKGFIITTVIVLCALAGLFFTSLYIVDKDEMAVITRFGKFTATQQPGLNFKLPFGIDQAYKIPVKRIFTEEFGYRTGRSYDSEYRRTDKELREATMLSADLKVINVEWIVQYKINDPVAYLFNLKEPQKTLREISIVAMSKVCGDYLFDEIITIAKSDITFKVSELLQQMSDYMKMGIQINTVQLMNVTPPQAVEAAYNEVLQAQQEKDKIVNEAKTEYDKKVIPVEGEAERVIAQARGYYAERVKIAEGEAKYFNSLYGEYSKAPEITKKRIYLETWAEVLKRFKNVQVIDESQKNVLPFLPLNNGQNAQVKEEK